jgi:Arc/MetJ family transcription regulator
MGRGQRLGYTLRLLETTSSDAVLICLGVTMRTTLALDDDLVHAAQEYTGVMEKTALVRVALKALIEREASRRLAALGGSMPDASAPPRRRTDDL